LNKAYVKKIKKRDGRIVDFDVGRINDAIQRVFIAVKLEDGKRAEKITIEVVNLLEKRLDKEINKKLANKALEFSKAILKEKKPHLLILDEINLALHWNLLVTEDVLDFLDNLPEKTDVVLTGRHAPEELIEKTDFVNIIEDVKAPKHVKLTKGIQY
jgi:ATP:corrinoid adenosyltransferase